MPLVRPSASVRFGEALNMGCPLLENLVFHDLEPELLSTYPQIVAACNTMKTLTITGKVHDARQIVKAVLGYQARNITRVRWTGGGGFGGGLDMEEFLQLCPKLERFETTSTSVKFGKVTVNQGAQGSMWIKDQVLPIQPPGEATPTYWACHATLTHLDVTFFPQKNIVNMMRFRRQVEHTYIKLGQLTALVALRLGCRCHCNGTELLYCRHVLTDGVNGAPEILDSDPTIMNSTSSRPTAARDDVILDMSLATGLGHLAGLKRLHSLCIEGIHGHKVGYPELEWMRENWSALRELRGVRNHNIMEWIQGQWPNVRASYLDTL
ncbi:hypothetical protein BGX31_007577 [Mortierella sp. GBA43]|nr:hypothetical protein BGX31_007577 [Mortierella sp. GBA43]